LFGSTRSSLSGFRPNIRFTRTGIAAAGAAAVALAGFAPAAMASDSGSRSSSGSPQHTFLMYDATNASAIPAHQVAAVYANGAYRPSGSAVPRGTRVLWIDVFASDPSADVLDVEPGDAQPSSVAAWAKSRLDRYTWSTPIVYTMRSEWGAAKASVATLPKWMQSRVLWWIADPTGHPHLLPGSSATQWYWGENYDISTASSGLTVSAGSDS
jgi:hypothetical protein